MLILFNSIYIFSYIWNLGEYCRQKQLEYQSKGILSRREVAPDMLDPESKRKKMEIDNENVDAVIKCAFIRVNYIEDPDLPKSRLLKYCGKNKFSVPKYKVFNEDKLFRAIAIVNGKKYSSSFWYLFQSFKILFVCKCSKF